MDPEDRKKMEESGLSKEEFLRQKEEKNRIDHPEDYEELKQYESPEFKKYCKEKYPHDQSEEIFENS